VKEKVSDPVKSKIKEKVSEPIKTKMKEMVSDPVKTRIKRKAKGLRTHIRRLKQEKSNDTIAATPKKKVPPKITQTKE
jgi:hypothetical protein